MNRKLFIIIILVIIIVSIIALGGYFFFFKNPTTPISTQTQKPDKTEIDFAYGEVIKSKIGINGGVLQNADKSVIATIPPLKQATEFTLSFKKSNFEVRSGIGSPVTISLYPDISLIDSPTPISIKVKYDAKYDLPVPYLIDEKNKLHLVNMGNLDKENNYFTMLTFHGGDYSWIYDTELFPD